MRFVGLDVHKREVEACVVDERGKIRLRTRFACTQEALTRFLMHDVDGDVRVALEATTNTWAVAAVVAPLVAELVISNPMRTRAIAEAKIKTDKVDAYVLAQLLRVDFLPRVWMPDEHTMDLRRLTTHRAALVADRTRYKNRIHAILHQRLIRVPFDDLYGKAGLKWLKELELDITGRAFLDAHLKLIESVEAEIAAAEEALLIGGSMDPRVKLLVTLPGIDVTIAQTLLAALGDPSRFKDGDHAASYLGLVPMTKQSGDRCYNGPITKQGRSHARWMLVQAAQNIGKHPGPLGVFFRRLLKRKNRNIAVVATARKLVTIAWLMLKNNEPYRYAQPQPTEAKLRRLRIAAGHRKKHSGGKGRPPKSEQGTRKRTDRVRALSELYEDEGLPAIDPPFGEEAAIERMKLKKFVAAISSEHRVERRTRKKGI